MSTLKDKLEAFATSAPDIDGDNDDDMSWIRRPSTDNTKQHDADEQIVSSIRKTIAFDQFDFDEKYSGEQIDRNLAFDGSTEPVGFDRKIEKKKSNIASRRLKSNVDHRDDDEDDNDKDDRLISTELIPTDAALSTFDSRAQIEKGKSVIRQLQIGDDLLHLRIRLQGALRLYNQLPRGNQLVEYLRVCDTTTKIEFNKAKKNLSATFNTLLDIHDRLLATYSNTKHLVDGGTAKADSDDDEIESSDDNNDEADDDIDDVIEDDVDYNAVTSDNSKSNDQKMHKHQLKTNGDLRISAQILANKHSQYNEYRNSTLKKWDERTRLAIGGRKMTAKKDFTAFDTSILDQIDKIMSDRSRLIRRTQTKRSDIERIGSDSNNTELIDPEIFDDDDFYQQLLKDLIDRRSADINDPVAMSRHFLEVQKLRQKRPKTKVVDTKASKGRKVRYDVMPKLVNFLPADPNCCPKWSEEARTELFRSLFKS